jgi:peptidoglycan/LPS O-acetylase OafA/YrhL
MTASSVSAPQSGAAAFSGASLTRGKGTLYGVEAARGIAATLVVFYHSALHLESQIGTRILYGIAHFGHAGVDFFFVLSGFIITYVHHRDFGRPERLSHYAQRRFTRVFPFYWLVLAYTLAGLWLLHRSRAPGGLETAYNILLLPHANDPVVGGAWTLVFEVTFYAAMATAVCSRMAGAIVLAIWLLLVLAGFAGFDGRSVNAVLGILCAPFSVEFFLGITAAAVLLTRTVPRSGFVLTAGIGAFALAAAAEVTGALNGYGAWARIAYGVPSMMVVLGLVELERSGGLRVRAPLAMIGRSSYAIYLVHLIAIGLAFKFLSRLVSPTPRSAWVWWLGLSAVAVLAGILASRWLEQPSIRFFRRRLGG